MIIKDILSVIKGQQKLLDPATSVTLALGNSVSSNRTFSEGIYLAFEYGRVGVVTVRYSLPSPSRPRSFLTQSSGIFVVTLDAAKHSIIDRDSAVQKQVVDMRSDVPTHQALAKSPFPYLHCCQVLPFQHELFLDLVTCLQMTETKMFFTWNPRAMPDMVYRGEPEPVPHWSWFNPPHHVATTLDDNEWPPLPGAAAPAVMQVPGGPPIDDGELDDPGLVEFNAPTEHAEQDEDFVADEEEDWEELDDGLAALDAAGQGNVPAVVPHQFLFHRATNCESRASLACIGLIFVYTSYHHRLHRFHGGY